MSVGGNTDERARITGRGRGRQSTIVADEVRGGGRGEEEGKSRGTGRDCGLGEKGRREIRKRVGRETMAEGEGWAIMEGDSTTNKTGGKWGGRRGREVLGERRYT